MQKLHPIQLLILLLFVFPACTTSFTSGDTADKKLYLTVKNSHFFNTNESLKKNYKKTFGSRWCFTFQINKTPFSFFFNRCISPVRRRKGFVFWF